MTNYIETRSSATVRPEAIDTTSSKYYVYERKNIRQETRQEDTMGGNEPVEITEWVYDERQYTKDEYANLNSASTQMIMQTLSDVQADVALMNEVVTANV